MARRAVLFDLGGVLLRPGLQHFLGSCERDCALPRNFLREVMFASGSDGPYAKAMRGQITLTQLLSLMEEGCRQHASASGITLPPTFSVTQAFEEMTAKGMINAPLLQAARVLRRNGLKTGILTNNWVDDSAGRLFTAMLMNLLHRHFDLVIESCRLGVQKPDPKIYTYALDVLQAKPQELLTQEEPLPTACDPSVVSHGYVPIRPGIQLHFVEMGHGPVICLCHGFPESWLSWRYQIPALADAGFRVIAVEMKGYGESTAPPDVKEYSQEQICKDLVVFLDKLGIPQAVLVGHDWGGAVVWNMALFYPERVRAVASLNTPYRPADPTVDIVEKMKTYPTFEYQFYFQEPGIAEAELEKDIGRTLKVLIRSVRQEDRLPFTLNFHKVWERGGLLVGFPEDPPASQILHGPELQYYIQRFKKSGFSGPLNWYRNMRPNWHWALSAKDRKITMPALMVTAGKDVVLHPSMSRGMEEWIPQLHREHIEECGHWTQMERPAVVNRILVKWLEGLPPDIPLPKISRL
ncbi:bifunctional epoxide hydrolase 2 isoform X2 [Falco rusticolus]|uniref:bifunctional epoxide hydrolase 2 isoform X2 n=1 Tax=Falco rusticolus TaxID=120794 RepID=UPI00188671CB|nr:bifunctional epoxide hydrolase 2 isoform X2 [Falco rusticolus]XP_055569699.1 bifunctional epoxide hydrolase 2 isoform X2 [Falco cherrug]